MIAAVPAGEHDELTELEELLTRTLRTIGRGRTPRGKPVPAGIGEYRS
jgi:hypothetical protein